MQWLDVSNIYIHTYISYLSKLRPGRLFLSRGLHSGLYLSLASIKMRRNELILRHVSYIKIADNTLLPLRSVCTELFLEDGTSQKSPGTQFGLLISLTISFKWLLWLAPYL